MPKPKAKQPRKIIMWATIRGLRRSTPDSIERDYRTAKGIVWDWKRAGFHWAKNAYVQRVEITLHSKSAYDIYKHNYKRI